MFERHQIVGKHYQIIDRIGEGGMGMVFRALDTNLHREVALKFIHTEYLENRDSLDRFMAEGRILASLRQVNVCEVYTLETDEATGAPFLVMECIKGRPLTVFMKQAGRAIPTMGNKPPESQGWRNSLGATRLVLGIFLQILDGIEACHQKGIVHRDIKPENILIDENEKAKIIDFGIAKTSQRMTKTGTALGTARYMSPEQCLGKSELSQKSDVYSLGILLWELLLGQPTFCAPGASDSNVAIALMHVSEPVPIQRIQENPNASPFGPILEKMLAKSPEDRPDIPQVRSSLQTALQLMNSSSARTEPLELPSGYARVENPAHSSSAGGAHARNRRDSKAFSVLSSAEQGTTPQGSSPHLFFLLVGVVTLVCGALWGINTGRIVINGAPVPPQISGYAKDGAEEIINSLGMKLRLISTGTFLMGSPASEEHRENNEQQHQVTISKPFYLGVSEVTQAEWLAVMGTTVSQQRDRAGKEYGLFGDAATFPMYYVNWDEAQEFCRKLSEREGKTYRLPTEAEWEYACRAGATGPFTGNSGDPGNDCWYAMNSGRASAEKLAELEQKESWQQYFDLVLAGQGSTHPVKGKNANAWGLYDMHGNVWEWCQDWYHPSSYEISPVADPLGPETGVSRVDRGGGWAYSSRGCRSAFRGFSFPTMRSAFLGFRIVRLP